MEYKFIEDGGSSRFATAKNYVKLWLHRNDEIKTFENFEGQLQLSIGRQAYVNAADTDKFNKVASLGIKNIQIAAGSTLGAIVGGLATGGNPVGVRVGALAGATYGEYCYETDVKPFIEKYFPDKKEVMRREYTTLVDAASKIPDSVWYSRELTTEQKIDHYHDIANHYEYYYNELAQINPLAANAVAAYREKVLLPRLVNLYEQLPKGESGESTYQPKKPISSIEVKPSRAGVQQAQEMLNLYGIKTSEIDQRNLLLLAEIADQYEKDRNEINARDALQFFKNGIGLFGMAAEIKGNSKQVFMAQVGQGVIEVIAQSIALPGALAAAPTFFAAMNPIMGIGMAVLSLGGLLLNRRSSGNSLAPLMKQIQQLSQQIASMHRDMIHGFNLLAEGQQRIYTRMLESFNRIENKLRDEHSKLAESTALSFERAEQLMILLNERLNAHLGALHLKDFKQLLYTINQAVDSKKYAETTRKEIFSGLARSEISYLENWILYESASPYINGNFYQDLVAVSQIENAEALLMSILLSEKALSYFVSYLAHVAEKFIGKKTGLNIEGLVNPDIWLAGATSYFKLRQKFMEYGIDYDKDGEVLDEIIKSGTSYQELINNLQANQEILITKLIEHFCKSIDIFSKKVQVKYFDETIKELIPNRQASQSQRIEYAYDPEFIQKNVGDASLKEVILQEFESYRSSIDRESTSMATRLHIGLRTLFQMLPSTKSTDAKIYEVFDRPAFPLARHKSGTNRGESHLEVDHIPEHFSHFEDYGFRIPYSLSLLFEQNAGLRGTIPKVLYLAEALGLGSFDIQFRAVYVNNNHQFTDPAHTALNEMAFYNYRYQFELFYIDNSAGGSRHKICEFECFVEQIPFSPEINNAGQLTKSIKQRMLAVQRIVQGQTIPQPFEYWVLGNLNAKINTFNQIKYFIATNHLKKVITSDQESKLIGKVQARVVDRLNDIRSGFYGYFSAKDKRAILSRELDSLAISRNLLLSFMRLLGFEEQHLQAIADRTNFDSSKSSQNVIESENTEVIQTVSGGVNIDALDTLLLNAEGSLVETLKKKTAEFNLKTLRVGHRMNNITLIVDMLSILRIQLSENLVMPLANKQTDNSENVEGKGQGFLSINYDCDLEELDSRLAKSPINIEDKLLDVALQCKDSRIKNSLVKKLVLAGAYASDHPQKVVTLVQDILRVVVDKDLEDALGKFQTFHKLEITYLFDGESESSSEQKNHGSAWPLPGARAIELSRSYAYRQDDAEHTKQSSTASRLSPWFSPTQWVSYLTGTWTVNSASSEQDFLLTYQGGCDLREVVVQMDDQPSVEEIGSVCYPVRFDEVNGLACQSTEGTIYVFPKTSSINDLIVRETTIPFLPQPINEDIYDTLTCSQVEFHGKSAVYCEGEKTTMVIVPHQTSFNFNGNLMLGAIAFHATKQLVNWIQNISSVARADSVSIVLSGDVEKVIEACQVILSDLRLHLTRFPAFKWAWSHNQEDLDKLRLRLELGKPITHTELEEFAADVDYLHDELKEQIKMTGSPSPLSQNRLLHSSAQLSSLGIFASASQLISAEHPLGATATTLDVSLL